MPSQYGAGSFSQQISQPASNAVQRFGVRGSTDAINFLKTEWVNFNGMNNVLLYASGVYQQNGSSAPYIGNNNIGTFSDPITGTSVTNVSATQWRANGENPAGTNLSPTRGLIYVVNSLGSGGANADATGVFQFPSVASNNRVTSTYNSYVAIGAMWIGDTAPKRGVWYGGNSVENTITGRANLPNPSGDPTIPGSNSTYTETASQNQGGQSTNQGGS